MVASFGIVGMTGASLPKGSPVFTFSKSLLTLFTIVLLAKVVRPAQIPEWRKCTSFGRSQLQECGYSQAKRLRLLFPIYHKKPLPFFDLPVCFLSLCPLCLSLHSLPIFLFFSLKYLLSTQYVPYIGETAINEI